MTSFYRSYGGYGITRTEAESETYRGFLIYHTRDGRNGRGADVYETVRFGICVNKNAGPQGTRDCIDRYIDGEYLWNREVWDAAAT